MMINKSAKTLIAFSRLLVFILGSLSIAETSESSAQDRLSIDDIKREISRTRETVRQFYIDYSFSQEPDEQLKNSHFLSYFNNGGNQKFAFDGSRRYNSSFTRFFDSKMANESVLMVFDGQKLYSRAQKRVQITSQKSGSIDMCSYLNIFLWPISNADFDQIEREQAAKVPFLLRMLDSIWRVNDETEIINGYRCLKLVEEGNEREIFLAADLNFAPVEYSFSSGKTGRGLGKVTCRLSDFRQFGNVFFPFMIHSTLEILDAESGKVIGVLGTRFEVHDMKINELVARDLFEFAPSPGDVVYDTDTGEMRQLVTLENTDQFKAALLDAKRLASQRKRSSELVSHLWGWMLASFLCGFFALPLSRRITTKGRSLKQQQQIILLIFMFSVSLFSIKDCHAQDAEQPIADQHELSFDRIVLRSSRYYFDIDIQGRLFIVVSGVRTYETPAPVTQLLLTPEVSKELELANFQMAELRQVHEEIRAAENYVTELIEKNSFLADVDRARCMERLVPAIESGNEVISRILLPHQRREIERVLLIFQIRRLGLQAALATGLMRGILNCTPAQLVAMEKILKRREGDISEKLLKLRVEAVDQLLSILNAEQREIWTKKFGDFADIDRGVHGVFIEQLGSEWIELARQIEFEELAKNFPQLSSLCYRNNFLIGIDGRPRFDFARPGRPPKLSGIDGQTVKLLIDDSIKSLLNLSSQQEGEIKEIRSLQSEFHDWESKEFNELAQKHGWDQKVFNEYAVAIGIKSDALSLEIMNRIINMLVPSQMQVLERIASVYGLQRVGITFLLLHSELREELSISESQAELIQKKSEELFQKLRVDSAELERQLNQELISVLNVEQQEKLKAITRGSIGIEAGQFDVQRLLREIPDVAQEISDDQAVILRFLGKVPQPSIESEK